MSTAFQPFARHGRGWLRGGMRAVWERCGRGRVERRGAEKEKSTPLSIPPNTAKGARISPYSSWDGSDIEEITFSQKVLTFPLQHLIRTPLKETLPDAVLHYDRQLLPVC